MSQCRSCGEEIVWMRTVREKLIPVDAKTVDEIDKKTGVFDYKTMISHFATCTDAKKWRKK